MRFLTALAALLLMSAAPAAARPPVPFSEWRSAAAAGAVGAQLRIGEAYFWGLGIAKDREEALRWFRAAADQNHYRGWYMASAVLVQRSAPGDVETAIDYAARAAGICETERQEPPCNLSELYRALANYQVLLARYGDASISYNKALAAARRDGGIPDAESAALFDGRGGLLTAMGKYSDALSDYQQALDLYRKSKGDESPEVAGVLFSAAIALNRIRDNDKAIAVYRASIQIYDKIYGADFPNIAYARVNIGWALAELKRYDEGYAESAAVLPAIVRLEGENGLSTGYVLNNMGLMRQRQGRHEEAIRLNLRAAAIYERFGEQSLDAKRWAYHSLALSYRAEGKLPLAILMGKLAVNAHQAIRAKNSDLPQEATSSLDTDWQDLYGDLSAMLVEAGRISEAQYVLNLQKRQELVEFVRRDASAAPRDDAAALTGHEAGSSAAIARAMEEPVAIAAELDALAAKQAAGTATPAEIARIAALTAALDRSYESFVSEVDALLSAADEESAGARGEITALNLDYAADRQEMLKGFAKPTVLLQAASLGDTLHLFLTTKDISVHREVKIARAALSKKVFDALNAIAARDPEADAQLGSLYGDLVKPVEADLKASGAEVIMLNLGGFLRYLPFAALKSDHGYLIEDYAIALDTPAAQTKFEAEDRRAASAAGFGVTAAHPGFSPLPGVASELEAIFKGHDDKGELTGAPVLDQDFTADSLKAALKSRPRLLHVASHFKFVPGNETNSFLLLGDGEPLTLEQIRKSRGLRFGGVDLLTLSACETARGGDGDGGEVESFGAIAQMNGASAVMATLWPIADEASGRLMADFYKGLVEDGLDKADALRRAQIAMLRGVDVESVKLTERGATGGEEPAAVTAGITTRHPYYWSPYILMGNWL